jgi:crotonobetainyl-CoA:carnitine CoA-transferase CaiB-like acyl-CoA transferase
VPYQDFPTADGYMILAIGNDGQFAAFCQAVGQPAWAADERFARNDGRVRHRATLVPMIKQVTVTRSTADWVALFETVGVPCGPINTLAEVFQDPQVRARGVEMRMEHPAAGPIPLVASPIRMSGTPVQYRAAPPQLGQDTGAVLQDLLGLPAERIAAMKKEGVVQ